MIKVFQSPMTIMFNTFFTLMIRGMIWW